MARRISFKKLISIAGAEKTECPDFDIPTYLLDEDGRAVHQCILHTAEKSLLLPNGKRLTHWYISGFELVFGFGTFYTLDTGNEDSLEVFKFMREAVEAAGIPLSLF